MTITSEVMPNKYLLRYFLLNEGSSVDSELLFQQYYNTTPVIPSLGEQVWGYNDDHYIVNDIEHHIEAAKDSMCDEVVMIDIMLEQAYFDWELED